MMREIEFSTMIYSKTRMDFTFTVMGGINEVFFNEKALDSLKFPLKKIETYILRQSSLISAPEKENLFAKFSGKFSRHSR